MIEKLQKLLLSIKGIFTQGPALATQEVDDDQQNSNGEEGDGSA